MNNKDILVDGIPINVRVLSMPNTSGKIDEQYLREIDIICVPSGEIITITYWTFLNLIKRDDNITIKKCKLDFRISSKINYWTIKDSKKRLLTDLLKMDKYGHGKTNVNESKHLKMYEDFNDTIDEILDKISSQGIESLTDDERFILKNKKLPKRLRNKIKLNKDGGELSINNTTLHYDDVLLNNKNMEHGSGFIKSLMDKIDIKDIEIYGDVKFKNNTYKCIIYVALDKDDDNPILWKTNLSYDDGNLMEYENDLDILIKKIINKYLDSIYT